MDRPTSSSIRNRGERPAILVNSAEVELSDIPPPGSPAAESVGNVDIINGNTELRRQLSSHSRNREFTENDRNDDSSIYDTVSDVTVVTRSLRTWDVAALIINKMIGTGIFTTPGVVLSLTGSKSISIILWVVGGVHTLLCLTVYLEFGAALPYTGGELIYLDEMYYRPELLATIIFSGFFICFGTSTSNSIAFARYIILAAEPNVQNIGDLDGRLVGYIAITINVVTCLFLYFSNGLALALNRLNALYKIGLLLAVFIAGAVASREPDSGIRDFDTKYSSNSTQTLSALVYILFAYQGWENANYVAGEIKAPRRTLRNGAYLSVFIVTTLYVLVTIGLYLACDYTIARDTASLGLTIYMTNKVFGGSLAMKLAIALSAFGNMIAVTFTSSKVKQAIAAQKIIPFYRFILKNDRQFGTPAGALVLHCIFTTVMIIITIVVHPNGYNLVLAIFTYGHTIVASLVGASAFWIKQRLGSRRQGWKPAYIKSSYLRLTLATLFIGLNIVILVEGGRIKVSGEIPRYWWPAISGIVVAASLIYWGALRTLMLTNPCSVLRLRPKNRNDNIRGADLTRDLTEETIGQALLGVNIKILYEDSSEYYQDDIEYSTYSTLGLIDGSRRRISYTVDEGGLYATIGGLFKRIGHLLANYL